jgi:hypothetical protein
MLGELVSVQRRFGELDIDEDTAALLMSMSTDTIDRRLALARSLLKLKGCSHASRARCSNRGCDADLG